MRQHERRWLAPDLSKKEIESMLRPYPGDMESYPVDRSINKLGFNISYQGILNKKEYGDLPILKTQ